MDDGLNSRSMRNRVADRVDYHVDNRVFRTGNRMYNRMWRRVTDRALLSTMEMINCNYAPPSSAQKNSHG